MRATDSSFELPKSLVTHYPMPERNNCRLLSLDGPIGALTYGALTDPLDKLNPGDLLVFNNTRVTPMRLFGCRASGGKIEVLVKRVFDEKCILAHIRASKAPKSGAELLLGDDGSINAIMTACHDVLFEVGFNDDRPVLDTLSSIGHIPLPPYIDHPDENADREFYQTVYSEKPGMVAAPTTDLYFDGPLLGKLRIRGMGMASMTLHVGAGTFQSVRVDTIEDHIMHLEHVEVPQDMVDAVSVVRARGNRVIAVDTISICSPEGATQVAKNDLIEPFFDDTQVFICPGSQYKAVDALVTDSHLPEPTLIMLVSASAGYRYAMNAYKAATEEKYRFPGYGDVTFIMYNPRAVSERVRE